MDSGKVSIIMPAYNAEAFLSRSITSVCNQTYENWELLIVDDGSTDRSRYLAQSFASADPRIKLLCNEHGGTAKARNTAIAVAQGEYLAFIDADDEYHPRYLELLIRIALSENSELVICRITKGTDSSAFLQSNVEEAYTVITVNQAFAAMYDGEWPLMIAPVNKLYHRDLFKYVRFPEGRYFEDAATTDLVLYKASKVIVLNTSLYFYHNTPNSSSKTMHSIELLDREWALRSHWEFFFQEGRKDLAYLALPFYLVELLNIYQRVKASDKPEDCVAIRQKFEEVYKKYKRKLKFATTQTDRILAFRHPHLYDIRNMIRQDGIARTVNGFVKRKIKFK